MAPISSRRDISELSQSGDPIDPSFATTLAHGLDVLAAFRNSSGSLSNADLASHTGLSRPTVSRLTYTLAQLGYLKRDTRGRFALGLGVLAAAYPVLSALKVRQLARPLMRDFAAYAGGTVSIAMPFGLDFIYVETLRTTDAVPHVPDVGFTGTLATTAVGRALMSLATPDEVQQYLQAVKAERPEELEYVEQRMLPDIEVVPRARLCGFARRMAAGNLWRRRTTLSQRSRRPALRELRNSLVSLFRRADRARMRAADTGAGAEHPVAGGEQLEKVVMPGLVPGIHVFAA